MYKNSLNPYAVENILRAQEQMFQHSLNIEDFSDDDLNDDIYYEYTKNTYG
jgi:hypothetical protein